MSRRRDPWWLGQVSAILVIATGALVGCSDRVPQAQPTRAATTDTALASTASAPTTEPSPTASTPSTTTTPTPTPTPTPDAQRAFADVTFLAGEIGPREATSAAFQRAAQFVEDRFVELGYDVRRQDFPVPAGVSWDGAEAPAGTSTNVIASLPGTRLDRRHVVVGAHLDTVRLAPGAEDNASGVASVLEVARLVAANPPRVPVVFVAFGAEEPRGSGDDMHHFGSQAYVSAMPPAQRGVCVGAISLDRVGVGDIVPISSGGAGPLALRDALVSGAESAGVAHLVDEPNRSSDHWSFERNGLTGARLGSTPYAGYHSPDDVASVVSVAQLARVIMITWTTLQALT